MSPRIPNHLAGKRIGNNRIQLVSLLGEGAYGAVYHALIHRGGVKKPKQCAVKVIRTNANGQARQYQSRELELHQRVSNGEGIVTVYESFKEGNYSYLVMKLCPERDLWHAINRKRYLGKDILIKDVFTQILDAVDYCHSHSVFHRDIKPENILLCDRGRKAFLSDFGLAVDDCVITQTRTGSPWYMSPECVGALSSRQDPPYATAPNDVWALGVLLINLASGRQAPWAYAHSNDQCFNDFSKHPTLLRLFVPLSPDVHDLLSHVFAINPAERISVKSLKVAVANIKHFGIPTARLTEYYNHQRAVWKSLVVAPAPPRPIPPQVRKINLDKGSKIGAQATIRNGPLVSPLLAFLESSQTSRATASSNMVTRRSSCMLPRLPSPTSSDASSVDSDGPVTPEVRAAIGDGEVPDINIAEPPHDTQTLLTLPMITTASSRFHKQVGGQLPTQVDTWQSILDVMNDW